MTSLLKHAAFLLAIFVMLKPVRSTLFLARSVIGLLQWLGGAQRVPDTRMGGAQATSQHLWEWRHQNIPLRFYGGGADRKFEDYFSGKSGVPVSTVGDVVEWLLGCDYVSDPQQFNKRDYWQHPVEFEKSRKGDCEDFALWTWRKLVELGHDAEFMVGKWIHDGRVGTHAWVFLRHEGEEYVFETTGRTVERIIKPHEDVLDNYVPFAAVDRELRKKVYNGLTYWVTIRM